MIYLLKPGGGKVKDLKLKKVKDLKTTDAAEAKLAG